MPERRSRAGFRWQHKHRIVLHLLWLDTTKTPDLRLSIFKHIFHDDLVACGRLSSLTYAALGAQIGERRKSSQKHNWESLNTGRLTNEQRAAHDAWSRTISEAVVHLSQPQSSTTFRPPASVPMAEREGIAITREMFDVSREQLTVQPYQHALPEHLYRVWSPTSRGYNSVNGFLAHKFSQRPLGPLPPTPTDLQDVCLHLDGKDCASPYISTSCSLTWAIQFATLQSMSNAGVMISVITTASKSLDPTSVFYADPYHEWLQSKQLPRDLNARDGREYEFLIHHHILKEAVLHTFAVNELLRMQPILLSAQTLRLDSSSTTTIAGVLIHFGATPYSSVARVSAMISDLLQGHEFILDGRPSAEWHRLATVFSHGFKRVNETPLTLGESSNLELSFLCGVYWACGGRKPRQYEEHRRLASQHQQNLGLPDPGDVLIREVVKERDRLIDWTNLQADRKSNGHRFAE